MIRYVKHLSMHCARSAARLAQKNSVQDAETLIVGIRFAFVELNVIHGRFRRAPAQPLDHHADRLGATGEMGAHGPVLLVLHPAGQAEAVGLLAGPTGENVRLAPHR